jgi:hypothetical protein
MRTKEETIRLFETQANKSVEEIIQWRNTELKDRYTVLQTLHDWQYGFYLATERMDGKDFLVWSQPHSVVPKTYTIVGLLKRINKNEILKIFTYAKSE